ncbi:MAG: hypothetical protein AAF628_01085 [Planctomycetota bacterium]
MRLFNFAVAGLVACIATLPAQDQESLRAKLEKKRQSRFVKKATWELDYDRARARAAEEDKLIFAYFTRSYSP